jgi:hypothetical protein
MALAAILALVPKFHLGTTMVARLAWRKMRSQAQLGNEKKKY